jgi:hypothetical protein
VLSGSPEGVGVRNTLSDSLIGRVVDLIAAAHIALAAAEDALVGVKLASLDEIFYALGDLA